MRKLLVVALLAAVACGSDNGGSGGGVTGVVGGQPFTPTTVKGATADPTTCTTLPQPLGAAGVSAVALSFDRTGAFCTDIGSSQCPRHPSQQSVTVFVANVTIPASGAAPTAPQRIGAGTYTVDPLSVATVLQGVPLVVTAAALSTDATCGGSTRAGARGGTVRIDSITSTQIKGFVDIDFGCGAAGTCTTRDSLKGDFTADLCTGVDICAAASAQTACSVPGASQVCTP